jgi:hypothetical protein
MQAMPEQGDAIVHKPKARFVRDCNLEDGAVVLPRQLIVKEWEIENPSRDTPWPEDVKLVLTRDLRALSTAEEFPVPRAAPGEKVTVSAVLQTPTKPGIAEAYFRLADGQGNKFGQRFWVKLVIADSLPDQKCSVSVSYSSSSDSSYVKEPSTLLSSSSSTVVADSLPEQKHHAVSVSYSSSPDSSYVQKPEDAKAVVEPVAQAVVEPPPELEPLVVDDDFVTVPAVVTPPAAASANAPFPYQAQLEELASMGFMDRAFNKSLLVAHEGNTETVVNVLLNSM